MPKFQDLFEVKTGNISILLCDIWIKIGARAYIEDLSICWCNWRASCSEEAGVRRGERRLGEAYNGGRAMHYFCIKNYAGIVRFWLNFNTVVVMLTFFLSLIL